MKLALAFITLGLGLASAQSAPARNTFTGTSAPTSQPCADISNVGSVYIQLGNPSLVFDCIQSGALSLGQGAYSWTARQLQGGSGTTGTLAVAAGKAAVISNSITIAGTDGITSTLPAVTSGIAAAYFCGASSGNATCANTATGGTARVISGLATLASNSAVISGISPAFTSTTTFACASNDQTTVGNPTKVVNTSSSSITITNTTGASDVVAYVCVGY